MAIVVVSVIAIQFQRDKRGVAFAPPILIFPKGDSAAQRHVKTKANPAQAKALENTDNIQLFNAVAPAKNAIGFAKLTATKRLKTVKGIQKTKGRSLEVCEWGAIGGTSGG